MKLSEAIRLGSLVIKPRQGVNISHEDDSGCAIGMALIANGHPVRQSICTQEAFDRLAALGFPMFKPVATPCTCSSGDKIRLSTAIVHVFDIHVCEKRDMTLDQLVEWVASVEGDAPQPTAEPTAVEEKELTHA